MPIPTPAAVDINSVFPILAAPRRRVYPYFFIVGYIVLTALWIVRSNDMIDPTGQVLGADFITFWSGSHLTLQGTPEAAYQPDQILAASRIAVPGNQSNFIWSYPPVYQLMVAPLALLSYPLAWALWSMIGVAAFVLVLGRLSPPPFFLWLGFAFPGVYLNVVQGQNGLLVAALFGGALFFLDRRPILSGALIGLLIFKPTLGLLIPLALLCGRRWKTFLSATVTALALIGMSLLAFGLEPWIGFFENAEFASSVLASGDLPWEKMPSLFTALRLLGIDASVAFAMHIVVATGAAAGVAWAWWNGRVSPALAAAILASASLLVSPHINDHDLALLAIPLALLVADSTNRAWSGREQIALGLAWIAPLIAAPIAQYSHIQLGFLVIFATFSIAINRARTELST
jgi:hypothetical protein